MSSLPEIFQAKKTIILAFAGGLLLGPFISGMMGWQVTSTTLQEKVHSAVVEQQVEFCKARARAAVEDPSKLEYAARYELAKKWAIMPWQTSAESEVISGCSNELAESP